MDKKSYNSGCLGGCRGCLLLVLAPLLILVLTLSGHASKNLSIHYVIAAAALCLFSFTFYYISDRVRQRIWEAKSKKEKAFDSTLQVIIFILSLGNIK
ncbi:MAG: hypothetical protein LBF88_00875 [Planctomycetaceae bacterium]|jgi:hypothetical protein|nr:hypothetical protein [Planctomycetaceae bacterium]